MARGNGMAPLRVVTCNATNAGKKRCGSVAIFETENQTEGHVYYRCQRPECHALVVVCYNEEHVQ